MSTPVVHVTPSSPKVNSATQQHAAGYEAQGWALAQTVIAYNNGLLNTKGVWNRYVAKLLDMGTEARAFFIKALNEDTKARKAHVDEMKNTSSHEIFRKANATAEVNLSNLKAIARALNAGMSISCETFDNGDYKRDGQGDLIPIQPFTALLAFARKHLSETESGAKKKGRPNTSFLDKLDKFLNKDNIVSTKEDEEARQIILQILSSDETLTKLKENGNVLSNETEQE